MPKPAFGQPGSVVRVKGNMAYEGGAVGYVRRTKPDNGDDVLVHILSPSPGSPFDFTARTLSYRMRHLEPAQ